MPSYLTVYNDADSGPGTLREVLQLAASGDTIDFGPAVQDIVLTSGSLTIATNVTIVNDLSPGSLTIDGGGNSQVITVAAGVIASLANLNIINGSGDFGGAIENQGTLMVSNCSFQSSKATSYGGGIFNIGSLTVAGCTFANNVGQENGSAIFNYQGHLSVDHSTFQNNSKSNDGGGIANDEGSASISGTTFVNNSAINLGGALLNYQGSQLQVINSTFDENTAGTAGGAIFNSGTLSATDNTVSQNATGQLGGGLYTAGSTLLHGDIFVGNIDSTKNDDIGGSKLISTSSDNLVGSDLTLSLQNNVNGNLVGVTVAQADLGSLAGNGGPTKTLALGDDSLALGKGYFSANISVDQRGIARPTNQPDDIGAYQLSAPPSVTANPTDITVVEGQGAEFSASANDTFNDGSQQPAPTVQWWISTDGGQNFTPLAPGGLYGTSTKTDNLTILGITAAMNGDEYEAVFTNSLGQTATSQAATLTVQFAPVVTSNPASVQVHDGDGTTFSAFASGNPMPTVQWELSTDGGKTFNLISDGGMYSGATTNTLMVASTTLAMNGDEYEAVFTNTLDNMPMPSTATSQPAILTIDVPGATATSVLSVSNNSLQAGDSMTVSLLTKNAEGNPIGSGGLTVTFGLASPSGGQGTFSSVTDQGNGIYTATFKASLAGSNAITATIGGQVITTSLPAIEVTPGAASALKSQLSLSLPSIQLGGEDVITLQAEDAYGNRETSGGESVAFTLAQTTGGQGVITPATDNGNGTYTATITGIVDGSNTIEATLDQSTVTTAAPGLTITGSAVSASKSFVALSNPRIASGTTTTVELQAENASGQVETSGGLNVAFELVSRSGGQGTFSTVKDNGNGTYTAAFTGTLAGSNVIEAIVDGQVLTSKLPALTITAGSFSPLTSILTLSSSTVKAGSAITVTLTPEDGAGNHVTLPNNAIVKPQLGSPGNGQGVFGVVKNNSNGTVTFAFMGLLDGGNTITASVNGQALTSPAPVITVITGPISTRKSLVSLSSNTVQSGGKITVTLQAEDAEGNLLTGGSSAVVFKLARNTGGTGIFSNLKNNGNGIYTATFTGGLAGSNMITATIAGVALATPAQAILVTPGPVSLVRSLVLLSAPTVKTGGTITVTLQAEDAAGNKETTGGLNVAFQLASHTGGQGTWGSVTDHGNGIYTATFTASQAGSNTIEVLIDGGLMASMPPIVIAKS